MVQVIFNAIEVMLKVRHGEKSDSKMWDAFKDA